MSKYEIMTKYIYLFGDNKFGDWVIDRKNDGTSEHPNQIPFVHYSEMVSAFVKDVYAFEKANQDMVLNRYGESLNKHGIEWGSDSMTNADVSSLDGQSIMALIMGAVRAERFCDGALLGFFKDGSIMKWLGRLKEIELNITVR